MQDNELEIMTRLIQQVIAGNYRSGAPNCSSEFCTGEGVMVIHEPSCRAYPVATALSMTLAYRLAQAEAARKVPPVPELTE